MGKWLVELQGDKTSLGDLRTSLTASDWHVVKEGEVQCISSPRLDKAVDDNDARVLAEDFLQLANGALKIKYTDHEAIHVGKVIQIEADGTRKSSVYIRAKTLRLRSRIRATLTATKKDGSEVPPGSTDVEQWIEVACIDQAVRDTLHFFENPIWWNLYKVWEIICYDMGGEHQLLKRNWTSKPEKDRFTYTAQSREAIGDLARHATKMRTPKNPMSLAEAQRFMVELFRKWVQTKQPPAAIV